MPLLRDKNRERTLLFVPCHGDAIPLLDVVLRFLDLNSIATLDTAMTWHNGCRAFLSCLMIVPPLHLDHIEKGSY
jgi:hypothetical protein